MPPIAKLHITLHPNGVTLPLTLGAEMGKMKTIDGEEAASSPSIVFILRV
jgi:hypothetical protein